MSSLLSVLRLRVRAEADPGVLARVLERFQNINILPRRVIAEYGTGEVFHIEVDVVDVSEHTLSIIAAKVGQAPNVLDCYWHYA